MGSMFHMNMILMSKYEYMKDKTNKYEKIVFNMIY